MVYKNKDLKKDKYYYKKVIFSLLLIIYVSGLCTGCLFTVKNADNLDFVQKVTVIDKLTEIENTANYAGSVKFLARDLIFVFYIIILKYSGVLKGLCICIPFIMAVQNTCIYTILMYQIKIGVFNLLFNYILKDTAISFMVILYLFVVVNDIINNRFNPKKDIRVTLIYSVGILFIYIINNVIHAVL